MTILVIGSGGREHAIVWRLSRDSRSHKLFASPGNPGMAACATLAPPAASTPEGWLAVAESINAGLTVVGPEAPLVAGIADTFRAAGRPLFGPTAAQAQLEGSKVFAKSFFRDHSIPTARFVAAATVAEAELALASFPFPLVVKADGLAAGKGVIIAHDRPAALAAVRKLGAPLVIEEFLRGEEVSYIVLSDGRNVLPLPPAQDHKAAFDGDQGPNTGGMGAYSDDRILNASQRQEILDTIILPTVEATGFVGFLYAGLMMTADGPKLLEFNVRLGDPETQPLLHRLSSDFAPVLDAAVHGRLAGVSLDFLNAPSVCVVLASGGYPGDYATGVPIQGIEEAEATGATVFHAGTRQGGAGIETAGGRVLGVTASGPDLGAAIEHAYSAAGRIHFAGMHYRRDIGRKGLSRYNESTAGT
ncbi:MAG: phosphoribosylamine--glycine ligase [Bryobacterales bacterium]|nr:phosphoribosylamine--glycine ligase [Bryobacterales bacterium]